MRYLDKWGDKSKIICEPCGTKYKSVYDYDVHTKLIVHKFGANIRNLITITNEFC